MFQSHSVLVQFDPSKEIVLSCDTSPYGVGAVLAHVMSDDTERPIAYYSRSLAPAEKNYSQLDKEALAIIWAIKRFYKYIYGKKFKILTDHKALTGLCGQNRFLSLSAYDYVLEFLAGIKNGNVDGLSRLPLGDFIENVPIPEDVVCVLNHMNDTTATVVDIRKLTRQDPTLSSVLQGVKTTWPTLLSNNVELKSYYIRRSELNVQYDYILGAVG